MMKLPILPCAEKRASFVYRTKNVDNNDKDRLKVKHSHLVVFGTVIVLYAVLKLNIADRELQVR